MKTPTQKQMNRQAIRGLQKIIKIIERGGRVHNIRIENPIEAFPMSGGIMGHVYTGIRRFIIRWSP